MTTYPYSNQCNPPCPIVPIRISTILEPDTVLEKIALLDTASDISCIPPRIVQELNIQPSGFEPVMGVGGEIETKPTYTLNVEFNGIPFPDHVLLEFADEEYLLIGRDIMNQFHICFDGINLNVNIHEDVNQE